MNEKRFVDDGYEAIEDQSFTDTKTDKTYYVDYFDEIIDLCNELAEENQFLKRQVDELDGLLNKYGLTFEELEEKLVGLE